MIETKPIIWKKCGFLHTEDKRTDWAYSHCHKPTPLLIDDDTLRIYYGTRSLHGHTRTTFVDIDITDLDHCYVKYVHDKPVLGLGKIGTFDDSGANVSSLIKLNNGDIYMYYIGWNPSTTVHTRNSIGLAVSKDGGYTFERMFDGPILDRNKYEPYYTGAVDVKLIDGKWKLWYTYGQEWKIINQKPEIQYYIRYASSSNGVDWVRNSNDCILPNNEYECTARPSIIYDNEMYRMWYSYRNMVSFRTNPDNGYKAGYAESLDGVNWIRMDNISILNKSDVGWDSEAIAYPYVLKIRDRYLMLYNGNGFGRTGFGYALSQSIEDCQ